MTDSYNEDLQYFFTICNELEITKYKMGVLLKRYPVKYMNKNILLCIYDKTIDSSNGNIEPLKRYVISAIENNLFKFSNEEIQEFFDYQNSIFSEKPKRAIKKKTTKPKAKTLTERELQVLNAPMKTYGMAPDERSLMFRISKAIGMNEFILYSFVEKHGFDYVYTTYLKCLDREKVNGPAYFISAIKNDYWNLKDTSYIEENNVAQYAEIFDNATQPALLN